MSENCLIYAASLAVRLILSNCTVMTVPPESGGVSYAAAPPLGSFTDVGPLGILSRIPQRCHDRAEDGGMLFSELEVRHEVIVPFTSIMLRGMHITADDVGDPRRCGQGMTLDHKMCLGVIARQEKTLALHPVHGPPGGRLVLGSHHAHGACCSRLRRKRWRVGKLGHGIARIAAGALHTCQGLYRATAGFNQLAHTLFIAQEGVKRCAFKPDEGVRTQNGWMGEIPCCAEVWLCPQELKAPPLAGVF